MHAKIKDISGKKIKCSSPGCINSKDGITIMEKKEILNRWSEYVEDLFKDDRCKKPNIEKKKEILNRWSEYVKELFKDDKWKKPNIEKNIEGSSIFKEEVEAAIKKMKNGKAIGPDNIPVDIVKALDNLGIDLTTKLLTAK
ncbi:endonuclease-reverse transcriptase [Plakobranchus ocellatus]|uniref:Endonuclease-reverse transcriptase n=1 Tax=Plakobranchus ocellatus TaxID=259542 RepID=A0AAV4AQI8_9GAST|nr:endonuclease-reverse transcriptase [Plakobranchus ocellatus]